MEMKNINKISVRGLLATMSIAFMYCLMTSCGEVDMSGIDLSRNGLLNLTLKLEGQSQSFTPVNVGPYVDGDVIEFNIPSEIENPVDLSHGTMTASLENDCYMEIPMAGRVFDMSEPQTLRVILPQGKVSTYTVITKRVTPLFMFKKTWFKSANDLEYTWPVWIPSIGVAKEGFVVYDGVENYTSSRIKVYDEGDGTLLQSINVPTTFLSQVKTDDAGHIVAGRQNIYGAGFMLYLYEDMNAAPKLILDYAAGLGCQLMLGNHFTICGDITNGKAYVYAVAGGIYFGAKGKEYYCWEFNDGVPVNVMPTKVDFSSKVTDCWNNATMERVSPDADSDIYLSYYRYADNTGSRMYCINSASGDVSEMKPENFEFNLLSFKVFEIEGHRLLAVLNQTDISGASIKVFDITDSKLWSTMKPGDEGYNKFMLYESERFPANNLNSWGDITAHVNGQEAYVYATILSSDKNQAGVVKLTINMVASE